MRTLSVLVLVAAILVFSASVHAVSSGGAAASKTVALAIAKSVNSGGSGTVTSEPSGISCGKTCAYKFDVGTSVILTATPGATTTFLGWSGSGCSGVGTCAVTMDAAKTVKAAFGGPVALTVSKVSQKGGSGTVTATDINCGPTCKASYKIGTQVILGASASAGSTFLGWSGSGCSGTGMCTVIMDAAETVKATFVASSSAPLTIDWASYLNWKVGRAWQFSTTGDEGTFSEYIPATGTKNGYSVTMLGWSANWSHQTDYHHFGSDGIYFVGFYDGDDTGTEIFCSPPCLFFPATVVRGTQYTKTCQLGTTTAIVKMTFDLVNDITVPYGAFNNVLKVTQVNGGVTRTNWYAQGVGHIREYVKKPSKAPRTDELIHITDGNYFQPEN
jgi:hypothetical protein